MKNGHVSLNGVWNLWPLFHSMASIIEQFHQKPEKAAFRNNWTKFVFLTRQMKNFKDQSKWKPKINEKNWSLSFYSCENWFDQSRTPLPATWQIILLELGNLTEERAPSLVFMQKTSLASHKLRLNSPMFFERTKGNVWWGPQSLQSRPGLVDMHTLNHLCEVTGSRSH